MGARKNGRPRGRRACLLLSHVFFLAPIYFLAPAMQARCLYGLQGVLRFIARSGNHIVTSLHVDKNGLFNFFSGRKTTTNKASWSEINRNGLHSLEQSLDLEDNSITV